jgi:hypothetical protein
VNYLQYAREKLGLAVDMLDAAQATPQQRLMAAWQHFHVLDPAWLPADIAADLIELRLARTMQRAAAYEGSRLATIRRMTPEQVGQQERNIRSLYARVVAAAAERDAAN